MQRLHLVFKAGTSCGQQMNDAEHSCESNRTYSVTDNTIGTSKYVEFNHPPVIGTASISSNNVCEQGVFTINYGVPLNGETNVVWEFAMSPDYEWTSLADEPISANEGPLTLLASSPAGTTYKLRVKGVNGSGIEGNN
jgi:hypothetical protein